MNTLLRQSPADLLAAERAAARYWVTFTAEVDGPPQEAFEVFVANDGDGRNRFRTLVWKSIVPRERGLTDLVNQFFRATLEDETFSILGESVLSQLDVVVSSDVRNNKRPITRTKTPDNQAQFADFLESLTVQAVHFARFDFHTGSGELSFSYERDKGNVAELTLLMEPAFDFTPGVFAAVTQCHVLSVLREREHEHVDLAELVDLLNSTWQTQ